VAESIIIWQAFPIDTERQGFAPTHGDGKLTLMADWYTARDAARLYWPDNHLGLDFYLFKEYFPSRDHGMVFWHLCPTALPYRSSTYVIMYRLCECEVPDAVRLRADMRCLQNEVKLLG